MELTKEHFDQVLKSLATKDDLTDGLVASEGRIIKRIDDAQEELARMTNTGFEDVLERLDVRDQIQRHQKALEQISQKIGLHFEL